MVGLAKMSGTWDLGLGTHVNWALVEEKEEREKGELHQFMCSPLITF